MADYLEERKQALLDAMHSAGRKLVDACVKPYINNNNNNNNNNNSGSVASSPQIGSPFSRPFCVVRARTPGAASFCSCIEFILTDGFKVDGRNYWYFIKKILQAKGATPMKGTLIDVRTSGWVKNQVFGKGRAWICAALNARLLAECLKLFCSERLLGDWYLDGAFIRTSDGMEQVLELLGPLYSLDFELEPEEDLFRGIEDPPEMRMRKSKGKKPGARRRRRKDVAVILDAEGHEDEEKEKEREREKIERREKRRSRKEREGQRKGGGGIAWGQIASAEVGGSNDLDPIVPLNFQRDAEAALGGSLPGNQSLLSQQLLNNPAPQQQQTSPSKSRPASGYSNGDVAKSVSGTSVPRHSSSIRNSLYARSFGQPELATSVDRPKSISMASSPPSPTKNIPAGSSQVSASPINTPGLQDKVLDRCEAVIDYLSNSYGGNANMAEMIRDHTREVLDISAADTESKKSAAAAQEASSGSESDTDTDSDSEDDSGSSDEEAQQAAPPVGSVPKTMEHRDRAESMMRQQGHVDSYARYNDLMKMAREAMAAKQQADKAAMASTTTTITEVAGSPRPAQPLQPAPRIGPLNGPAIRGSKTNNASPAKRRVPISQRDMPSREVLSKRVSSHDVFDDVDGIMREPSLSAEQIARLAPEQRKRIEGMDEVDKQVMGFILMRIVELSERGEPGENPVGDDPKNWLNGHACMQCTADFTVARRRHHCRNCGGVFCRKCSMQQSVLSGFYTPLRVCDVCWGLIFDSSLKLATRAGGSTKYVGDSRQGTFY